MLTALFGIDDGGLNLAVNLLVFVLALIWLALVYWTYADAKRRIDDGVLVATATAASLILPFIGTIVYTILRPPEFLEDARERELETKAAELRLRRLTETSCPRCEHPVELSWLRCPECQHRLKDPCTSCGRPVDPRWAVCPHCESPVARRRSGEGAKRRAPSAKRPSGARRSESGRQSPQPKRRASSSAKRPTTPQKPAQRKGSSSGRSQPEQRPAPERPSRRRPTKT